MDFNDLCQWLVLTFTSLGFLFRNNFFATPSALEKMHSKIMQEVGEGYVHKAVCQVRTENIAEMFNLIRKDASETHEKLDKLTELIYKRIQQEGRM